MPLYANIDSISRELLSVYCNIDGAQNTFQHMYTSIDGIQKDLLSDTIAATVSELAKGQTFYMADSQNDNAEYYVLGTYAYANNTYGYIVMRTHALANPISATGSAYNLINKALSLTDDVGGRTDIAAALFNNCIYYTNQDYYDWVKNTASYGLVSRVPADTGAGLSYTKNTYVRSVIGESLLSTVCIGIVRYILEGSTNNITTGYIDDVNGSSYEYLQYALGGYCLPQCVNVYNGMSNDYSMIGSSKTYNQHIALFYEDYPNQHSRYSIPDTLNTICETDNGQIVKEFCGSPYFYLTNYDESSETYADMFPAYRYKTITNTTATMTKDNIPTDLYARPLIILCNNDIPVRIKKTTT